MKTYTKTELAEVIFEIIIKRYSDPENIYVDFKTNLQRKVKAVFHKDLTEAELERIVRNSCKQHSKWLNQIQIDYIESKISDEIVDLGRKGFDIKNERKYFFDSAKDRVNELINRIYTRDKKATKKLKK